MIGRIQYSRQTIRDGSTRNGSVGPRESSKHRHTIVRAANTCTSASFGRSEFFMRSAERTEDFRRRLSGQLYRDVHRDPYRLPGTGVPDHPAARAATALSPNTAQRPAQLWPTFLPPRSVRAWIAGIRIDGFLFFHPSTQGGTSL